MNIILKQSIILLRPFIRLHMKILQWLRFPKRWQLNNSATASQLSLRPKLRHLRQHFHFKWRPCLLAGMPRHDTFRTQFAIEIPLLFLMAQIVPFLLKSILARVHQILRRDVQDIEIPKTLGRLHLHSLMGNQRHSQALYATLAITCTDLLTCSIFHVNFYVPGLQKFRFKWNVLIWLAAGDQDLGLTHFFAHGPVYRTIVDLEVVGMWRHPDWELLSFFDCQWRDAILGGPNIQMRRILMQLYQLLIKKSTSTWRGFRHIFHEVGRLVCCVLACHLIKFNYLGVDWLTNDIVHESCLQRPLGERLIKLESGPDTSIIQLNRRATVERRVLPKRIPRRRPHIIRCRCIQMRQSFAFRIRHLQAAIVIIIYSLIHSKFRLSGLVVCVLECSVY